MGQYLVWYPPVHAQFRDELVFYLLTVNAFPKSAVYDDLAEFLESTGHTTYRIYRISGTFDIVLRVWVEKGKVEELARHMEREIHYIIDSACVTVEDIPHHWIYGKNKPTEESIARLTREQVVELQKCFLKPDTWESTLVRSAIDKKLVRVVDEIDGNIMFFCGITPADARKLDAKTLLQEIYDLIKQSGELSKTAVYRTKGKYEFLIKCETTKLFQVGQFIIELSNKIAVNRCNTVTSIVLDPFIRGREEIGKRSFKQVAPKDIAVFNILPELYEREDLSTRIRGRIESWIRDDLIPSLNELDPQEFQGIQACLRTVIAQEVDDFLLAILKVYGPIERELRKWQGSFVGRVMGDAAVQGTIQEALKRTPNVKTKEKEKLSLGDRLDVYVYVIKQKQLSEDQDVIGSWAAETQLRDKAAHFDEKVLGNWERELPLLIQFLRRYKKLRRLVLSATEGLHEA